MLFGGKDKFNEDKIQYYNKIVFRERNKIALKSTKDPYS